MFSNIEFQNEVNNNSVVIDEKFIKELKDYNKKSKINHMNKEEYRNKISKLYSDIGVINPIDNEINGVIYFDDYVENGVVMNKNNVSLKQVWTEYRLIYNEKKRDDDKIMENSFVLDNFDELFERISKKVDGLDKYIGDLNSLKKEVDSSNEELVNAKTSFELEKIKFENYRRSEMTRLSQKEKELNDKIQKINKLVSVFDDKMKGIGDAN